ncbi:MAG TPA: signal peptidase II [Planctomycetes bacterium]|nr:signal peptidase II [Planctomycetota bacterium]HIL36128.1 signal peptidase II [Planctomycetota bacterium]
MSGPLPDQPVPGALRVSRQTLFLRFFWLFVLVGADLGSKAAVMPWLEARMPNFESVYEPEARPALVRCPHGHLRHSVLGESVTLMHNLNYGAAFGFLQSIPWVLVLGRALAAGVLVVLLIRAGPGRAWHVLALILVLAGCLGNLWDNLTYEPLAGREGMPFGPVRDFIDVYFSYWDWHFPTFNVADSAISVGALVLIFGPHDSESGGQEDDSGLERGSGGRSRDEGTDEPIGGSAPDAGAAGGSLPEQPSD